MESVNGLYKTECIRTTVFHPGPFRTLADVEFATAGWVDWYNNRRLHGSLGMLTPIFHVTWTPLPAHAAQHGGEA